MRWIWIGLLALAAAIVIAPTVQASSDSTDPTVVGIAGTSTGLGYWMFDADGRIYNYGDADLFGSPPAASLNAPIVGGAGTATDKGYALFASDGGFFAYGDAPFMGSAANLALNSPIVGGALLPDNSGYYLFAADGGVFAYGNATFAGSMGGQLLNAPIVGGGLHPGGGYYLVAADGGVFAFGGAPFYGSAGGLALNAPITTIAVSPEGKGYYLSASDGGVFAYGRVPFLGSATGLGVQFSGFATMPDLSGYWLVTPDGFLQVGGAAPRLGAPKAGPPRPPNDIALEIFGQFDEPVALITGPGGSDGDILVATRSGQIYGVDESGSRSLGLQSDLTSTDGGQGLIDITLDKSNNLYVSHTLADGTLQIARYQASLVFFRTPEVHSFYYYYPDDPQVLLDIDQPSGDRNGGVIQIGPDGMLWIATGDGGTAGDSQGNAQDRSNLLGSVLRIDPAPDGDQPYGIPDDNPYASSNGTERKEIWAYGLRDPAGVSFDPLTKDLWLTDTRANQRQEISSMPSNTGGGYNFGWNAAAGGVTSASADQGTTPLPPFEYESCPTTEGYVYRGSALPSLNGQYISGDLCSGELWALTAGGDLNSLGIEIESLTGLSYANGGLYALSQSGFFFKLIAETE